MNKFKKSIASVLVLTLMLICIPQLAFAEDLRILKANDAEGKEWMIEAPASAPDALNGADEFRIEKNAKGIYVVKLFKEGKEINSKGIFWIYRPIPAGETTNRMKVDDVEFTFAVINDTWQYAAEIFK